MVEQLRLHIQRQLVSVLEEAVQEFEPQAEAESVKDPLSFLVAKGLEAAADLQTLWPVYSREGSVWETGAYRRKLLLLESLAAGVVRSLRRAEELALAYRERASEPLPRADELVASLNAAVEIHDRITRTQARLQRSWPAVDRNMITESRAALDRGEGEAITDLVKRLEQSGPLVKE